MLDMIIKIQGMTKENMDQIKEDAMKLVKFLPDSDEGEEMAKVINYIFRQKAIEIIHG